jgi:hypothetical protein
MQDEPLIASLSRRQLAAYNAQDIDAFCACFHRDVCVLDPEGNRTLQGHEAFRSRYLAMFTAHTDVFAEVTQRIVLGAHIVEFERWSRVERATTVGPRMRWPTERRFRRSHHSRGQPPARERVSSSLQRYHSPGVLLFTAVRSQATQQRS